MGQTHARSASTNVMEERQGLKDKFTKPHINFGLEPSSTRMLTVSQATDKAMHQ